MLASIGILARNEAGRIEKTIASLFDQTALRLNDLQWEVVVVANGCTDDTAERARRQLASSVSALGRSDVRWSVEDLAEGGKSNAWNRYVHEFSAESAELIVMLDADIEFANRETVANTIGALLADDQAVVAVDLPIKNAARKSSKSLLERMSLAVSSESLSGPPGVSGQFFCARASALRQIWMPRGLSVEDGFLRAMLVTNCFRSPADERKVIRAPNASHYYETLTSLGDIFRHELRIVVGSAMNCYLMWDFLLYATDPDGPGAGALIRNRTMQDPRWYPNLMTNAIKNHGWWALPRGTLLRRLAALRGKTGRALFRAVPVAGIGLLLDVPVLWAANQKLKSGEAVGYW